MTAHPNRNWRAQWSRVGDRVKHASGLVVELVRNHDGSLDIRTVDGSLPTLGPGTTQADVVAHRDHVRRLLDQAVTLLTAPKLP